jgi:hypothetical protein
MECRCWIPQASLGAQMTPNFLGSESLRALGAYLLARKSSGGDQCRRRKSRSVKFPVPA